MKFLIALPALALLGTAPPPVPNDDTQPSASASAPLHREGDNPPPRAARPIVVTPQQPCDRIRYPARSGGKVVRQAPPPAVRNLNELPDGEGYYAVWRKEGGCPVFVKFETGR